MTIARTMLMTQSQVSWLSHRKVARAPSTGNSRVPNQRAGRRPLRKAPRYASGARAAKCQAGPLIDQANGAGRCPGRETHQPYSRIGKLAHTAKTPRPVPIFKRKIRLRRTEIGRAHV